MNNTTKGESRKAVPSKVTISGVEARFLGFASVLNTKYDLSKLEAATEQLRKAWENLSPENLAIAVDGFLASITRQPAGEKQTTS